MLWSCQAAGSYQAFRHQEEEERCGGISALVKVIERSVLPWFAMFAECINEITMDLKLVFVPDYSEFCDSTDQIGS